MTSGYCNRRRRSGVYFHYRCTRIPREHLARCLHAQTYRLRCEEFLQGYVTSNTERITANECTAFAVLSPGSRCRQWLGHRADGRHWPCRASFNQTCIARLQPYLQFSKCKLEPSEDSVFVSSAQDEHGIPCLQIGIL